MIIRKLWPAVLLGGMIIYLAYTKVTPGNEIDFLLGAAKDFGVIIVGVAVVEVVWVAIGGSPIETKLKSLINQAEIGNREIRDDVRQMSELTKNASRIGLINVGENQEALSYKPRDFSSMIKDAKEGVDLCAATLAYVYAHDEIQEALVVAATKVPVRIILPASDSSLLAATCREQFLPDIKTGSDSLTKAIIQRQSNIKLYHLSRKALTAAMLRVDDRILVTPYLYKPQTSASPRFEIKGRATALFQTYAEEFEELIKISTKVGAN